MSDPDADRWIADLSRPQRLFLKRAYAASERKPWFPPTDKGAAHAVMEQMVDKGFARKCGLGAALSSKGHECTVRLSKMGWPNCEKQRPHD